MCTPRYAVCADKTPERVAPIKGNVGAGRGHTQVEVHEAAGHGGGLRLSTPFLGDGIPGQQFLGVPQGCIADDGLLRPDVALPPRVLLQLHASCSAAWYQGAKNLCLTFPGPLLVCPPDYSPQLSLYVYMHSPLQNTDLISSRN